ncbi:MAG: alpha-amylase family glycosyl hydrolase [Leptolyngbyaceae cyanobacterium]
MPTPIEPSLPTRLANLNVQPRGAVHPSPTNWRDHFFYQLLPDRFSDGQESTRPRFDFTQPQQYQATDHGRWMAAGNRFVGGTLRGVASKLDYLQNLGVTTLWLNPPWRQRADLDTYHGYGIQNFLDIDPRFGTRQDLRDLVDAAHERGLYVVLDVIYNHSGNNWFYRGEWGDLAAQAEMPYRFSPPYAAHGYRSAQGESIAQPQTIEDGVWPEEFQNFDWYTRCGSISHWEAAAWEDNMSPLTEFRRGDFFDLKDFNLQNGNVIKALARVYQYWIAVSDCDGFRVDAVKHVSPEESRQFCFEIKEYAQAIGKDNFLLMGEITDEGMLGGYLEVFGRNLDAALDIVNANNQLTAFAKGLAHPNAYFDLFNDATNQGSYRQVGLYHVSVLDDHDMSSRAYKARFAARSDLPSLYQQVAHVVGIQLTMPGIPSIYYGTEQALDGNQSYHDYGCEPAHAYIDRYIRESMFGGDFGAFGTQGCHFFDPDHPTYQRIAVIARLRSRPDAVGKTLRRGHHYLRETAFAGSPFAIHGPGELTAWSSILFDTEVLIAYNPHGSEARGADVTVDSGFHTPGTQMQVLYRGDWSDEHLKHPPQDDFIAVETSNNRTTVRIDLPPAGMMILA